MSLCNRVDGLKLGTAWAGGWLRVLGFGLVAGLFSLGCSGGGVPPQGAASGVKAEGGCSDGREILEAYWGGEHREAFRGRVMSLYRPSVEAEHARIAKALEQSTGRWLSAKEGVCEESKRGASSEVSLKKNRCLDDVMLQTRALVELVSAAPAEYVRDAPGVLYDISSEIGACSHAVVWESYEADLSSGEPQELFAALVKASLHVRLIDRRAFEAVELVLERAEKSEIPELKARAILLRGNILLLSGDFLEAKQSFERARGFAQSIPNQRRYIAPSEQLAANASFYLDQSAGSLSLFDIALKTAIKDYGASSQMVASIYRSQAEAWMHRGNFDKAELIFERAIDIVKEAQGAGRLDLARCYLGLGSALRRQGRYPEAESKVQLASQLFEELLGQETLQSTSAYEALGGIYAYQKKYKQALPLFQRALRFYQAEFGESSSYAAMVQLQLGFSYMSNSQYDEALKHQRQAALTFAQLGEVFNESLILAYTNMALVHFMKKELEESTALLLTALQAVSQMREEPGSAVAEVRNQLGRNYYVEGEFQMAFEQYVLAHRIFSARNSRVRANQVLLEIRILCSEGYQPACTYNRN